MPTNLRFVFAISLVLATASSLSLSAHPTCDRFLIFDHKQQTWPRADNLDLFDDGLVSFDAISAPTVFHRKTEKLCIRINKTNPLLYHAAFGDVTVEANGDLSQLGDLLAAIGGGLGALVQVAALPETPPVPVATESSPGDVVPFSIPSDTHGGDETSIKTKIIEIINQEIPRSDIDSWNDWKEALEKRARDIAAASDEMARQQKAVVSIIQAVEQGDRALVLPARLGELSVQACQSVTDAIRNVTCPTPTSATDPALMRLDRLFECLDEARCQVQQSVIAADNQIGKAKAEVELLIVSRSLDEQQAKEAREFFANQIKMIGLTEDRSKKLETDLKSARAALDQQLSARKVLINLLGFEKRFNANFSNGEVNDYIILGPWPHRSRWNKTFTQTVNVNAASPYKGDVVAGRPEKVATKFKVSGRAAPLLGFGIALTHSDLTSPEFGTEMVTAGDGSDQLIITQIGEKKRSSELAIFMNYRFVQQITPKARRWLIQPGFEVGASAEGDPGFFAGLSFEFGRHVRLGYGYTYQQVNELVGSLGDPVASADEIKTRDSFEGDTYISLTVVIDSFSLFKKK